MDKRITHDVKSDLKAVKTVSRPLYKDDEKFLAEYHDRLHAQRRDLGLPEPRGKEHLMQREDHRPQGGGLHTHPANCDCPAHHHSGGCLDDGRVHLRDLQKMGVGRRDFR